MSTVKIRELLAVATSWKSWEGPVPAVDYDSWYRADAELIAIAPTALALAVDLAEAAKEVREAWEEYMPTLVLPETDWKASARWWLALSRLVEALAAWEAGTDG